MKFEFASHKDFNFIESLAKQIGCEAANNIIKLPASVGTGYIKMVDLEHGLKLVFHRHLMKKELVIKRNAIPAKNNLMTITFNTADKPIVFLQKNDLHNSSAINLSSVYITSTDIALETHFPCDKTIHSTIIIIHSHMLKEFLEPHTDNTFLQNIISGNPSFWYDAHMTPDIRNTLREIDEKKENDHLNTLFYKIKIQQLIYQLFIELLEKENRPHHSLNKSDIERIYCVRETVISNLNKPPLLYNLARSIGMSETKMRLLFRQIFGKSIYSYYQSARMEHASKLLKDLSVFETGYELGFTNMSYFSKLFKKHHHLKPKKFKSLLSRQ
jgi:AraC-like DNA-binding protein